MSSDETFSMFVFYLLLAIGFFFCFWYRNFNRNIRNHLFFLYLLLAIGYFWSLASLRMAGRIENVPAPIWLGGIFASGALCSVLSACSDRRLIKAAEQGSASAQYELGLTYKKDRSYAEAAKWFHKAAAQGHVLAQYTLGVMYKEGPGVPHDYAEAAKWFHKAAEQGHVLAQYTLGVMYENGWGVPEDKVLAYALYNLAAAGDPSKKNKAPSSRGRIAEALGRDELAQGQALTLEFTKPGNFGKALDAWLAKRARKSAKAR